MIEGFSPFINRNPWIRPPNFNDLLPMQRKIGSGSSPRNELGDVTRHNSPSTHEKILTTEYRMAESPAVKAW